MKLFEPTYGVTFRSFLLFLGISAARSVGRGAARRSGTVVPRRQLVQPDRDIDAYGSATGLAWPYHFLCFDRKRLQ